MELHHLPQDYTSSGRRVETKLSKPQQIDAITDKNVQDMITLEVLNLTSWGTKSQLQHYDSFLIHVLISLIRLNPKNPSI